MKHLNL